jgi:hypothetical protein
MFTAVHAQHQPAAVPRAGALEAVPMRPEILKLAECDKSQKKVGWHGSRVGKEAIYRL